MPSDLLGHGLPIKAMTERFINTEHQLFKTELPAIEESLREKSVQSYEHTSVIASFISHLQDLIFSHLAKEENVLFPWSCRLEAGDKGPPPCSGCSSILGPIRQMKYEHQVLREHLEKFNNIVSSSPPEALHHIIQRITKLKDTLVKHLGEEEEHLFPQILKLEK